MMLNADEEMTVVPCLILIGRNDADFLGKGWHPAQEGPGGVACRWMSQKAEISLPDKAARGARRICVTVSAPTVIRGEKPGLSVYVGELLIGHCADLGEEGNWSTAIIHCDEWPVAQNAESARLTIAIENRTNDRVTPLAFVPHEVMGNGDLRELGALVASARVDWKTTRSSENRLALMGLKDA